MAAKSLDGVLTKKANQTQKFTKHQIEEIVKCMDPKEGYLHFARNYAYIQHPVKGKMLFEPYEYQVGLLESYHNYRFNVNMLPRQAGKTICAAVYLAWYAMFHADQSILVAAHKFTGAQEIMQRIRYIYEMCPDFIRAGVTSYNKGSIEFENGSRIVSATTTATTGRGMSISLLYLDEFAFVAPSIASEFWTSISPTLSTGGRAIITSTPNSDEDTFANIWKEANHKFDEYGNEVELGVNGFHSYSAHWSEHPDRDEKWKKEELGRIGEERFRREFELEFLIFDETLINSNKLSTMKGMEPIFKTGHTRWYTEPKTEYMYIVALDPSMGTGGDNASIQVLEVPSYKQVAEWSNNTTTIPDQIIILRDICKFIDEKTGGSGSNIYWSVENNGLGEAALLVINDMGEENIPGFFLSEPMKKGHVRKFRKGFNTTFSSKVTTCSRLKIMTENDQLEINSKPLISELKTFVAAGSSYNAKSGSTDDLISALILALRMISVMKDWDPKIFNSFKQISMDEAYEPPMPIFISSSF